MRLHLKSLKVSASYVHANMLNEQYQPRAQGYEVTTIHICENAVE